MTNSYITISNEHTRGVFYNHLIDKISRLKKRLLELKDRKSIDPATSKEIEDTVDSIHTAVSLKLLFIHKSADINLTLPDLVRLDYLLNEPKE